MDRSVRDCLTDALNELADLKRFIHKLCECKFKGLRPIGIGRVKDHGVTELVNRIISHYGEGNAGEVTVQILEAIDERYVSDELSRYLENIRNSKNVANDEMDASVCRKAKFLEDTAHDTLGLWSLSAMECYASENMDELCKALEDKIEIKEVRGIEKHVRGKKMKTSLLITAKDAQKIIRNLEFKQYSSQPKGGNKKFPLSLVASYLFEGKPCGGQGPSKGQRAEVRSGNLPVDMPMCDGAEEEPSGRCSASQREHGVVLAGELQKSRPSEDEISTDMTQVKGLDKDGNLHGVKQPSQDLGFGGSLSDHENAQLEAGEVKEDEMGNDGRESGNQRLPQVPSSKGASQFVGIREGAPLVIRLIRKARRKAVWNEEQEAQEKMEAKRKWLIKQARQILEDDDPVEQVANELEDSLQLVHVREHPRYPALQARNCLVYTTRKDDPVEKVLLLLQLPTEPDGETFSSRLKSGDLDGANRFRLQYHMGVLGGISRADVVFYSRGHAEIRQYMYNRNEFNSIRASLEGFIKDGVLPVLAVYMREQRKQGVFLDRQN